ncbi:hypothetical protein [Glycomyces arizonensis]|uniref:hypothetical protein n=1 Tax=Glycomyces arizonensis TaxID=256035 RepID=UPI001B7FDC62|nr:hypothetical protein [Glycomyces arizonensis]
MVEVEEMAREAIAMMLDVPIGEVAVRIGDRRYRAAHRAGRGAATPSERRESLRGLLDAHVAENDVFTAEELAEAREALYGSEPEDPRTANS